jgi:hypothetical protein
MAYVASTYGSSLINGVSVAAGKNVATIVDLTAKTAAMLLCKILVGGTAPTIATTFNLYRLPSQVNGSSPITTITTGVSIGATGITLSSMTGITGKCVLLLINQSTGVGELVTVTSISGAPTISCAALTNAYTTGAYVFVMEQTASGGSVQPGSSWVANTEYSTSIYPPSFVQGAGGLWAIVATNGDSTNAVTVNCNMDYVA